MQEWQRNVRSSLEEFSSLHPCPSSGAATKSPIQMLLSNLTPINPVTPAVAAGFKPTVAESLPQIHMYVFKTESKKLLSFHVKVILPVVESTSTSTTSLYSCIKHHLLGCGGRRFIGSSGFKSSLILLTNI